MFLYVCILFTVSVEIQIKDPMHMSVLSCLLFFLFFLVFSFDFCSSTIYIQEIVTHLSDFDLVQIRTHVIICRLWLMAHVNVFQTTGERYMWSPVYYRYKVMPYDSVEIERGGSNHSCTEREFKLEVSVAQCSIVCWGSWATGKVVAFTISRHEKVTECFSPQCPDMNFWI